MDNKTVDIEMAVKAFAESRPDPIKPRRSGTDPHAYKVYLATQETRILAWRSSVVAFAQAMGLDVSTFTRSCEEAK